MQKSFFLEKERLEASNVNPKRTDEKKLQKNFLCPDLVSKTFWSFEKGRKSLKLIGIPNPSQGRIFDSLPFDHAQGKFTGVGGTRETGAFYAEKKDPPLLR